MKTAKYFTFIETVFETESTREFFTKKDALSYFENDSLAQSANVRRLFKLDANGYKEYVNCKFNKEQ